MDFSSFDRVERRRRVRAITVMTVCALLIIIAFLVSTAIGTIKLSPLDVVKTIFGAGTDRESLILFQFRLPRIVLSILVGAGLAVSGCLIQGMSRNALADPGILGINAGAGLMVVLFISFFPTDQLGSLFFLPFLALLGAGVTSALIYVLSYKKNEGLLPTRMILVGVAVAAAISAAMIILTLRLDPESYQFVATWLAGSIWGSNWSFVLALLPWIVILIPYAAAKGHVLNVLNLGDSLAAGLGARIEKERLLLLAAAVGLAGACVSVSGGISFVGLIAPHVARRLVGPKHETLIPAAALVGALLVIVADTLGRWILQPSQIPTGIVVAVIGAPYFLYLLAKAKTSYQ
ncbi:FecCD family ABC transporter permease [Camelliibacillus cellulosilyticus]|uniref:FecCD family ABC transporter permease n=1 Tax=Camelliibacillus cellulosilyticus TaxID=2174486 RepID=A0ABV9GQG6_9BACL